MTRDQLLTAVEAVAGRAWDGKHFMLSEAELCQLIARFAPAPVPVPGCEEGRCQTYRECQFTVPCDRADEYRCRLDGHDCG